MSLTSSQQSAFTKFEEFINSDDLIFILKGSAGTGKTTLLKALVESLCVKGWKCVLMATGRASYILGEKTGHSAATIHRTIYQIEEGLKEDGSGQLVFDLRPNDDSQNNTIYFVDEASMVSDQYSENDMFKFGSGYLLRDVLDYCGSRKIVFVGDYAQLPPVGQTFSPAMSAEYLQETYHASCREAMLKEVVRQVEDSFVYKNATFVRDAIESNRYNEFAIKDGEDVKKSESLIEDYKSVIQGSIDQGAIVIAYTNKQVLDYNLAIRKYLFQSSQERLIPGDLLIVSQNNYHYSEELYNGTIVRVLTCDSDAMLEKRTVRFNTSEKDAFGESVSTAELAEKLPEVKLPGSVANTKLRSMSGESRCQMRYGRVDAEARLVFRHPRRASAPVASGRTAAYSRLALGDAKLFQCRCLSGQYGKALLQLYFPNCTAGVAVSAAAPCAHGQREGRAPDRKGIVVGTGRLPAAHDGLELAHRALCRAVESAAAELCMAECAALRARDHLAVHPGGPRACMGFPEAACAGACGQDTDVLCQAVWENRAEGRIIQKRHDFTISAPLYSAAVQLRRYQSSVSAPSGL